MENCLDWCLWIVKGLVNRNITQKQKAHQTHQVYCDAKFSETSQHPQRLKISLLALSGRHMPSSHFFVISAIDNALFFKPGSLTHKKGKKWRCWFFWSKTPIWTEGQGIGLFSFLHSEPGTSHLHKLFHDEEVSRRQGVSYGGSVKWSNR